ncbi:MFS transporter [Bogoriella caseilytica]|uniref:Putative MFS family arabinose efflux permease n=1 Tax=Bogoriella caseilytica TaxID=56055 RepID=A0A3N2BBX8_9MICO|nr:MFS transporter [Bogoriella caseilytica]ROR72745.1 putative MFS family arabinose efflux permease [Bogoriella caseilytica]
MIRRGLIDLRPLRANAAFRRLWVGNSISGFGGQIAMLAVLFHVWEVTGNPLWTGMIGLVSAAGMITGGFLGGTLADSHDRRTIICLTTSGQALAAAALAVQAALGLENVGVILTLVGMNSLAGGLGAASRRSLPARLLSRQLLPAGIALTHLTFQASMLIGPALSGFLIAGIGLTACYTITAIADLISLYLALRLPRVPPVGATTASSWTTTWQGLRFVSRPGAVRGAFGTDLFATLLAFPIALFPMVNDLRLGGSPETLGLMSSALAVGGILAGVCSGLVTRTGRLGVAQSVAAGVWCAALAGFGLGTSATAILLALVVAGAADTVSVISRGALVQLAVPDEFRGRITAVDHVIGAAGPSLGNARAGWVAAMVGAPVALAAGAAAGLLGVLWIALRNRELREFDGATGGPGPTLAA